jgi:SAM-dependent methyltransferase
MANDLYHNYFLNRGCDPTIYSNYKIPIYLEGILPKDFNARILDIGCGFGQLLRALKERGYKNLSGVDLCPEAVDYCQKQGLDVQKIKSLQEHAQQSTVREYDFVIMSHVLEHMEKDKIIFTLKLIRDVLLKQDGRLLVMVPNAQSNTGCYWAYEDFTHHTLFTAGSLAFCLRSAGFEEISFLDPQGIAGNGLLKRAIKSILLKAYEINYIFWNKVTSSAFHQASPRIFTFEVKALTWNKGINNR